MYGIYNAVKKEFQFGICEPTPLKASKKLYKKIGKDSYKWRFEVKLLPEEERGYCHKCNNLKCRYNVS